MTQDKMTKEDYGFAVAVGSLCLPMICTLVYGIYHNLIGVVLIAGILFLGWLVSLAIGIAFFHLFIKRKSK